MKPEYWQRQSLDTPLFPNLIWNRPENRAYAGKLLIIGGNLHGFAAPAEAYATAEKAGIGVARVVLPDAVKKIVGPVLENGEFAPSNPSGSFSQKSLAELLRLSGWADGVLLAGDIGRNSETAIVLEKFVATYKGSLIITKDAIDYFKVTPLPLLRRPNTTLVLSVAQLQKFAMHAAFPVAVTFGMDLIRLAEFLHEFTQMYLSGIIVKHHGTLLTACSGHVTTTTGIDQEIWRVKTAAHASVWQLQNPGKQLEALTTAIYTAFSSPSKTQHI